MGYKRELKEIKIGPVVGDTQGFPSQEDAENYLTILGAEYNDPYAQGEYVVGESAIPIIIFDPFILLWFILTTVVFMVEECEGEDCEENFKA